MNPVTIVQVFDIPEGQLTLERFGKGHIHDTYRIDHENGSSFILQRMNTFVFVNPAQLMDNLVRVCNHLQTRSDVLNPEWENLRFYPTRSGNYYWMDENEDCWRLFNYISHTEITEYTGKIYYNAGRAYGNYILMLNDMPAPPLYETIPHFHDLGFRMDQHNTAKREGNPSRISAVEKELEFIIENQEENLQLSEWIHSGKIPRRITHNDAKVTNILFNSGMEVVSIIDLDTSMELTVHSDFGDALRSFGSSVVEDDRNVSLVHFRMDIFEEFSRGFLIPLKDKLTPSEVNSLAMAPSYFAYMQAVRFLTDYLMNDVYYHTDYEEHNLVRTRNQLALYTSMKRNEDHMREIIHSILET